MDEEQRDEICDLLPRDMVIWDFEDELGWFANRDVNEWREILGHPYKHRGCCATCGCATSCLFSVFHEAMIGSVIRELDKLGLLLSPPPKEGNHDDVQPE